MSNPTDQIGDTGTESFTALPRGEMVLFFKSATQSNEHFASVEIETGLDDDQYVFLRNGTHAERALTQADIVSVLEALLPHLAEAVFRRIELESK